MLHFQKGLPGKDWKDKGATMFAEGFQGRPRAVPVRLREKFRVFDTEPLVELPLHILQTGVRLPRAARKSAEHWAIRACPVVHLLMGDPGFPAVEAHRHRLAAPFRPTEVRLDLFKVSHRVTVHVFSWIRKKGVDKPLRLDPDPVAYGIVPPSILVPLFILNYALLSKSAHFVTALKIAVGGEKVESELIVRLPLRYVAIISSGSGINTSSSICILLWRVQ